MKRIFLSLVLAVGCCAVSMADTYNYLTLVSASVEQSVALKTVKRITFTATDLVVTSTDGSETTVSLANFERLFFSDETTAVRGLQAGRCNLCIEAGRLVADGRGMLLVYNTRGQVVRQQFVSGSRTELNLGDLPRGIFVARLGNATLKVLN